MSPQRDQILRELGIGPQWRLRESMAPVSEPAIEARPPAAAPVETLVEETAEAMLAAPMRRVQEPAAPVAERAASPVDASGMDWNTLATAVAECRACNLCKARKQAVLGVGDQQADWLFVGEGPGAEEDERGEPFVGQAGKLLDAMLAAINLRRGENVYIANSVKCRPPNNRTPEPEETAACWPYLERQIELLQPKLIVALGRPAAQTLLQREVKIGAARGQLFDYKGIPLIVTYHPAYLLRNLSDKAKAWEDLCFARRTMA
ncbi:MAG TPA: uracil-DNA glycosylase [Rhodocyclaceae bacterium]